MNGNCTQSQIVKAFGVTPISVKRAVKKYREGGSAAFFQKRSPEREPRVLTEGVVEEAQALLDEGKSREEAAEALGIKPDTLYRAVKSGRLVEEKKGGGDGRSRSDRSVEDSAAAMGMACTRVVERVCAATGKMQAAPSRFEPSLDVSCGGVLWALPALLANGLLRHTSGFRKGITAWCRFSCSWRLWP